MKGLGRMSKKKIGVLTGKGRADAFIRAFQDYDVRICLDHSTLREQLSEWDKDGYAAAVMDDVAIEDKQLMIEAMRFISNAPRDRQAQLRPIFLASSKRPDSDPVYSVLATSGIYDLIINQADPFQALIDHIENPAKRGDVITYIDRVDLGPMNVTDLTTMTPEGVSEKTTLESPGSKGVDSYPPPDSCLKTPSSAMAASKTEPMPVISPVDDAIARSNKTISIGVMVPYPRSGSTNLSQTVARSIALCEKKVALLVPSRDFKKLKKLYPSAVSNENNMVRVSGIDIYFGFKSDFAESILYDYVVVDFGSMVIEDERIKKEAHYTKTDFHMVQIPLGSPNDIDAATQWIQSQTPQNLVDMTIMTYSATQEVHDRFVQEVHRKSPKTRFFIRGYQPWPLSLKGVPESISSALGLNVNTLGKKGGKK